MTWTITSRGKELYNKPDMPICKGCGAHTVWNKEHHAETGEWIQFDPHTSEVHNCSDSIHLEGSRTITITNADLEKIISNHYRDITIEMRNISRISQKATVVLDKVEQFLEQPRITDAKVDRLLAAFTNGKWVRTNTVAKM
jgi:hypothetical protein